MRLHRSALMLCFVCCLLRAQAPNHASCVTQNKVCYSPQEIRTAYGLNSLLAAGYTGAGQTILVVLPFGSPTVQADLDKFDASYGLPNVTVQVMKYGNVPPFDPTNGDHLFWALRADSAVEWAHAMAPDAKIVLAETATALSGGSQGVPEILNAEQNLLANLPVNIAVQPWDVPEEYLLTADGGDALLDAFSSFFRTFTVQHHVTFLAPAGNTGSSYTDVGGNAHSGVFFPASSPWVTAIGGSSLYTDTIGNYQSETVWNNPSGATGGGVSQYFAEPAYQLLTLPRVKQGLLNHHRGLPDLAIDADPHTGLPVYTTFDPMTFGFTIIGGTELAAAEWGGIVAIANQYAKRPLGFLNPSFYLLGAVRLDYFFLRDITLGSNEFDGVAGYSASPSWDLTTGWGTPNLSNLIPDLAKVAQ